MIGLNKALAFLPLVEKLTANFVDVDHLLIIAMIMKESSGVPCAIRHEPHWHYFYPQEQMISLAEGIGSTVETEYMGQATSWGLMQVMGTVAREHGFRGWFAELCEPKVGLKYGILHLKKMWEYKNVLSWEDAIAAYNAGGVRKTKGGMYINQQHVDEVMRFYRDLTGVR